MVGVLLVLIAGGFISLTEVVLLFYDGDAGLH